jgi:preprotein translocase subunit SecD
VAKSSPVKNARRSLSWLGVIVVTLVAVLAGGVLFGGASWAPKLGLDLEGGTEIILAPQLEGGQKVTSEELNQAVSIIRQRVDASGVSEAQVSTQGTNNIVVSIPGQPDDATMNRIKSSSKLELRPVLLAGAPSNTFVGADGKTTPYPSPAPTLQATPSASPTNGSDTAYITPLLQAQYDAFDCGSLKNKDTNVAPSHDPLVTCDDKGEVKYLLGPVEVSGSDISNASAGMVQANGATTGQWAINLVFNGTGTKDFGAVSSRLVGLDSPRNQFAFVLDGKVLSAPVMQGVITDGKPQITGSFT